MLDFEKPITDLENQVRSLRETGRTAPGVNLGEEVGRLEGKIKRLTKSIYASLTPKQRVQVARAEKRPHFIDYVGHMVSDFTPLAGDRLYGDDHALMGGLGRFRGQPVVIMGHEKGHDLNTRLKHNFGMPCPEGYRKAIRLMQLADQFKLPIITLVDTAGAYPGIEAEARGQAEAIARSMNVCLSVNVPIVSVIVGEGGSGGAIAIATADRVYMLENAIYSVISPEGCASILWRNGAFAGEAAAALKLTANDMMHLKLIDGVIAEPLGGAHRNPTDTIEAVSNQVDKALRELARTPSENLRNDRRKKYLAMGRDLPTYQDKHWFFQ